ncbi:hypothetical protein ACFSNO_12325 [Streptomyces cirratus]
MKKHRDELFAGVAGSSPTTPVELFRALCAYVTQTGEREVRLMLEPFPPDTVSGLWLDMGDFEVIAVEKNTSSLHQMVIVGTNCGTARKEPAGSTPAAPVRRSRRA